MKYAACSVMLLTFVSACSTAPSAPPPVVVQCPQIPPQQWDAPERNFIEEMRSFLQGTPSEPKPSASASPTARPNTTPR